MLTVGRGYFPTTLSIDGQAVLAIREVTDNLPPVYLTNHQDFSGLLCQIVPFLPSQGRQTCFAQSPLQEMTRCPAVGSVTVQWPPAVGSFGLCLSFSGQSTLFLGAFPANN